MRYINRNLLPDEQIMFRTSKHLIIFFIPLVWTIFAFFATSYMNANFTLQKLSFIPWVVALLLWFGTLLSYLTSEFAVTNKRLMMREGVFLRHSNEMRLSTISQVNVDQSLFGQILGYGTLSINAFGAYDSYSRIANPFEFQKSVNEQLDKLVR